MCGGMFIPPFYLKYFIPLFTATTTPQIIDVLMLAAKVANSAVSVNQLFSSTSSSEPSFIFSFIKPICSGVNLLGSISSGRL